MTETGQEVKGLSKVKNPNKTFDNKKPQTGNTLSDLLDSGVDLFEARLALNQVRYPAKLIRF